MAKQALRHLCAVCGVPHKAKFLVASSKLGPLQSLLAEQHPDLPPEAQICYSCLSELRSEYILRALSKEKGELSQLEQSVLETLKEQELYMQHLEPEEPLSLGDRIADKVAAFGGSWKFIGLFSGILVLWVLVNSVPVLFKPFDPYPFILMNLFLSLVAALQAPVIMMSQNRAEARDRARAESDFRTNLMAELEIRQLHQKLDHLINNQWQRLLEIQQLQTELLQELARPKTPYQPHPSNPKATRRTRSGKLSRHKVWTEEDLEDLRPRRALVVGQAAD